MAFCQYLGHGLRYLIALFPILLQSYGTLCHRTYEQQVPYKSLRVSSVTTFDFHYLLIIKLHSTVIQTNMQAFWHFREIIDE